MVLLRGPFGREGRIEAAIDQAVARLVGEQILLGDRAACSFGLHYATAGNAASREERRRDAAAKTGALKTEAPVGGRAGGTGSGRR